MKIYEVSELPDYIDQAIDYFWKNWGNDSNFNFYKDCLRVFNLNPKDTNLTEKFF